MKNKGLSGLDRLRMGKTNSDSLEKAHNKSSYVEDTPSERVSFNDTYPNTNSMDGANFYNTNVGYNEGLNIGYQEPNPSYQNPSTGNDGFDNYGRSLEMEQFLKEKSIEINDNKIHNEDIESVSNAEVVSTSLAEYETKSLDTDIPVFPSVRSLIRKTSVVKEIPKIKLDLICDTFTVSISANSIESAVNEFRKECLKGGLDDLTTSIAIDYKEDLSIHSDTLDCNVKSDFEISNYTEFDKNQVITVGMAMEALFDRTGIGYLLN